MPGANKDSYSVGAVRAFVKIEGSKQGAFKGDSTQKATQGMIVVHWLDLNVESPRDAGSGLATGKRQYKPFHFEGEIGPHYVQLLQAISTNESIKKATFQIQKISHTGVEEVATKITLTNASVASLELVTNESQNYPHFKCALSFQKIEVEAGQTMMADDWSH